MKTCETLNAKELSMTCSPGLRSTLPGIGKNFNVEWLKRRTLAVGAIPAHSVPYYRVVVVQMLHAAKF